MSEPLTRDERDVITRDAEHEREILSRLSPVLGHPARTHRACIEHDLRYEATVKAAEDRAARLRSAIVLTIAFDLACGPAKDRLRAAIRADDAARAGDS